MDARTLADRIELGLKLFSRLRQQGVFGPRLRDAQGTGALEAEETQVFALENDEPVFVRKAIHSDRPRFEGYLDVAVQPWLGSPVLAVAVDVQWDPPGFQDRAKQLGYRWRRWVSYAAGQAALDCDGVLLDPYRAQGGEPLVVPPREARADWGLSGDRQDQNRALYALWQVTLEAMSAASEDGRPLARWNALHLCAPLDHPKVGNLCLSKFAERRLLWCVPAALEMAIEYQLAQRTEGWYQGTLARALGLYGGTGLGSAGIARIPRVVENVTRKKVSAASVNVTLGAVSTGIDRGNPLALVTANHAYLVFGYGGVGSAGDGALGAFLQVVNPWGRHVEAISLAGHGASLFELQRVSVLR